jgi:hypothetical protein
MEETLKIMWLNESLILRGETSSEKSALNTLYQTIGNERDEVSGILEFSDAVDVLETRRFSNQ